MSIDDVQVTDTNATSMVGDGATRRPARRRNDAKRKPYYEQKIPLPTSSATGPNSCQNFPDIDPTMGSEKRALKFDEQPNHHFRKHVANAKSNRPVRVTRWKCPGPKPNTLSNRPSKSTHLPNVETKRGPKRRGKGSAGQEYADDPNGGARPGGGSKSNEFEFDRMPTSYYRQIHLPDFPARQPLTNPAGDVEALTATRLQKN